MVINKCKQCARKNPVPASRLSETHFCKKCNARLGAIDEPVEITDEDFDEVVSTASIPVIVGFFAHWCEHSKDVAPELARLAREEAGRVLVCTLDADENPDAAAKHNVDSVPSFIRFDGGWTSRRLKGAYPLDHLRAELM